MKDVLLPPWLAERGLSLSEEKTRIVHLTEGFDFLGFNVRHYAAPLTSRTGYKLLIRPSKKSVNGLREKMRDAWRSLKGQSVSAVLGRLNPIIRGWANYYRTGVAKATFSKRDDWMHRRAMRYARSTHPTKPTSWLKRRYWGKRNKERDDQWVCGDKRSGHHLLKFSWFKIERHRLVKGRASPDDASLREYWWQRRKVNIRHLTTSDVRLAENQDWVCPICMMDLVNGEPLERHHKTARSDGGSDSHSNRVLLHLYCHQQKTAEWRKNRRCSADA